MEVNDIFEIWSWILYKFIKLFTWVSSDILIGLLFISRTRFQKEIRWETYMLLDLSCYIQWSLWCDDYKQMLIMV
jgi:hypothetical protein